MPKCTRCTKCGGDLYIFRVQTFRRLKIRPVSVTPIAEVDPYEMVPNDIEVQCPRCGEWQDEI